MARARLLAHVLDASEDPEGAEGTLRAELYAARLSDRPTVVFLDKVEVLGPGAEGVPARGFPGASRSRRPEKVSQSLATGLEERLRWRADESD